jgi:hypothetical protein
MLPSMWKVKRLLIVGTISAIGLGAGVFYAVAGSGRPDLSSNDLAMAAKAAKHVALTPSQLQSGTAPSGWPSNVQMVDAVSSTRSQALALIDERAPDVTTDHVIVVRMTGSFTWVTTGPPGSPDTFSGNAVILVIDPATGDVIDSSLAPARPDISSLGPVHHLYAAN